MSTNSSIIVKRADGKYSRIYAHWDGYLTHNGRILRDHYATQWLAEALVAMGSVSALAENIGTKHDFDWRDGFMTKHKGDKMFGTNWDAMHADPEYIRLINECNFYHRDRGEPWKDTKPRIFMTAATALKEGNEYVYLWMDGGWFLVNDNGLLEPLGPLVDAALAEEAADRAA